MAGSGSSGKTNIVSVPITGSGSAVADGTMMMRGVTADTDLGLVIPISGAGANALGRLLGAHATANDSLVAGTTWTYREIELLDCIYTEMVEYDQADTMAVASTSGTNITITSLENNIDTGWLYAVSGTGAGKLAFLTASASGSATSLTATGWDSTTAVIKIVPIMHGLVKYSNTTRGTKIGTDAAAGSGAVRVWETWFEAKGISLQQLDPTKHDNLTLINARFYARLSITGNAGRA